MKTKHSRVDIGSSVLILMGLALIVPEFSLNNQVVQGALLGVLSAVIYSFRNLWNKKHINTYSGSTIMCYQLLVSAIVLLPAFWTYPWVDVEIWWLEMVILVVVTTAVAHTLFVQGLRYFTTSSISIMSSLIPVYGVIWALIFTDESLNTGIVFGGLLIVATTALQNVQYLRKVI
jgi:drug/metabolite transporter (DMT)-like permease